MTSCLPCRPEKSAASALDFHSGSVVLMVLVVWDPDPPLFVLLGTEPASCSSRARQLIGEQHSEQSRYEANAERHTEIHQCNGALAFQ